MNGLGTEYCIDLRQSLAINREGVWSENGSVISHSGLIQYLNRSIRYDPKINEFYLRSGLGRAEFSYHETPLVLRQLQLGTDSGAATLNTLEQLSFDPTELAIHPDGPLVYRVNAYSFSWVSRSVYHQLSDHVASDDSLEFWGKQFTLQKLSSHKSLQ